MEDINKISDVKILTPCNADLRVTIENVTTGEILYRHTGNAGVVSIVEDIQALKIDPIEGSIEGVTQKLAWGKFMFLVFAFDQLRQEITKKLMK